MEKSLDTPYVYFVLQDDLLTGTYKENIQVTLEIAKCIVKDRLEFANHRPVLVLLYVGGAKSIDKKARDYFSSEKGVEGLIAAACVVKTKFSSFMINFYLSVTTSRLPARVFSNKEAALKWLQQFRK